MAKLKVPRNLKVALNHTGNLFDLCILPPLCVEVFSVRRVALLQITPPARQLDIGWIVCPSYIKCNDVIEVLFL